MENTLLEPMRDLLTVVLTTTCDALYDYECTLQQGTEEYEHWHKLKRLVEDCEQARRTAQEEVERLREQDQKQQDTIAQLLFKLDKQQVESEARMEAKLERQRVEFVGHINALQAELKGFRDAVTPRVSCCAAFTHCCRDPSATVSV